MLIKKATIVYDEVLKTTNGNKMIDATINAIKRQNYEDVYMAQQIPVLGAIVSIPTALVSGAMVIRNLVLALFQKINTGTPFFGNDRYSPLEQAKDLSLIFANNVLNLCTAGIFNNILITCIICGIAH